MFDLPDRYVWDFWTAYDAGEHHLFFLHAPAALGDPDLRHDHARVGHAVSTDLVDWRLLDDPLPTPVPGFDDLATWTGSVVHDGAAWRMFVTGRTHHDDGMVQRIGSATSADLRTWSRDATVVEADPRCYRTVPDAAETHWRDPWLERDDTGTWHLYATARALAGGVGAGVIGHATSTDLETWRIRPPLSEPTGRFDWLEVLQVAEVDGRRVWVFNCLSAEMPGSESGSGGVWTVPAGAAGEPVDVSAAVLLLDERHYVGKLVERDGTAYVLAFRNHDGDGAFVGGISDPMAVRWRADGRGLEMVAPYSAQPGD